MEYKVYCLIKNEELRQNNTIVRVKVFADCISDALNKAKDMFLKKLKRQSSFQIFMYETTKN